MLNVEKEEKQTEVFEYGVEVPQLMSMFINSVYSSKDMFLREAVSNASDALTKLFESKATLDGEGYKTHMYNELKIEIIPDVENNTLIIRDNGIGMTKDDLKNFLGNIASSGTAKFREAISAGAKNADDLIGQFGLGFYSLFLISKRVDVITKNPRDRAYLWSSDGQSKYEITNGEYEGLHGTTIYLRLKKGEGEFLKSEKLIALIKKHSMYIKYPIAVESEVEVKEEKSDKKEEETKEINENDKEEKETPTKKVKEMKVVNSELQVWKKKVADVPEEDLKKFYKEISGDYNDYLAVESFHLEGIVDVKLLLFIPSKQKMNFFTKQSEKCRTFKIYNNNVFITDEITREVIPEWLDFMCGTVTSPDFSLNISREFLQGTSALKILKNNLPKCVAKMIAKLQKNKPEDFKKFTVEFSKNIKMAINDLPEKLRDTYADFLTYPTNKSKEFITLRKYCDEIGESEKQILYLTGMTLEEVESSICLDGYKNRTVLLMGDPADEIMLQRYKTFNGLNFQNISSEGVLNADGSTSVIVNEPEYEEFGKKIQEILKNSVEKVVINKRSEELPATILTQQYGYSSTMENIIRANRNSENDMMVQMMLGVKKILEINPDNEFIKDVKDRFDNKDDQMVEEMINFLYQSTLLGCGYPVDNKIGFIRSLYKILSKKAESSNPTRKSG